MSVNKIKDDNASQFQEYLADMESRDANVMRRQFEGMEYGKDDCFCLKSSRFC